MQNRWKCGVFLPRSRCERVTPLFRRPVSLVFPRFTRHWIYNRKARGKKLREGEKEELETALVREQCSFARIRLEELFFVKVSQQISKNFWRLDAMFLPCQLFFAPIWQDKSWNTNIFRIDRPIILRCLYGWWMDVETLTRIAEFFAWLNLLHARLQLYRRSFVRIPEKREEYKIFVGGLQARRKNENAKSIFRRSPIRNSYRCYPANIYCTIGNSHVHNVVW